MADLELDFRQTYSLKIGYNCVTCFSNPKHSSSRRLHRNSKRTSGNTTKLASIVLYDPRINIDCRLGNAYGFSTQPRVRQRPYYIRIKDNGWVRIRNKKYCQAKKLFCDLNLKEQKPFLMSVEMYKKKVYLAGSRSERGELMIVATNQQPKNAIAMIGRINADTQKNNFLESIGISLFRKRRDNRFS